MSTASTTIAPEVPEAKTLRFTFLLGLFPLLAGVASLAGWALDIQPLTNWGFGPISMLPNTSVAIALCGLSILLTAPNKSKLGLVCATVVVIYSGLNLIQHMTGLSFGFDSLLLFGREWGNAGTTRPGRTGVPASVSFLLLGMALMMLSARAPNRKDPLRKIAPRLALAVGFLLMFSIMGHMFGATSFYAIPWLSAISFQTAVLLSLCALGVIFLAPDHQPMAALQEKTHAAWMGRIALPLIVVLYPLISRMRLVGLEQGYFDEGTGRSLTIIVTVSATLAVLWWALMAVRARELASKRAGELFQAIFERSGVAQAVIEQDSGRFLRVNQELTEITGFTEKELLGMRLPDLLACGSVPSNLGDPEVEHEYVHKDGKTCWATVSLSTLGTDEEGVETAILVLHEITARRAAEEALRESEQRYQAFIGNSSEGIWRFELDEPMDISMNVQDQLQWAYKHGYLAECNHAMAAMYGFEAPEQLIGARLSDLMPRNPENEAYLLQFFASEYNLTNGESKEIDANGATLYFSNNLVGIIENGKVVRVWGSQTDRTRQKQAEIALLEADRRKDEFLATLAHELRNPLAPIVTGLELLRFTKALPPEAQATREMIERQVQQLVRLVDDLLEVSRISRGIIELRKDRIDLNELLRSNLEPLKSIIEGSTARFSVDLPDHPVWVDADAVRLSQVFTNLLVNAFKFTPDSGEVNLKLAEEAGNAVVKVQDTGVGITETMQPRIFEAFVQDAETRPLSQGGLGIGLMLVRRITELHDGEVEVYSSGKGEGSTFTVRLPLSDSLAAVNSDF